MDRAFDYEVQLKAVKPEDVLGRPSAIHFDESVNSEIKGSTILVTGAGGSMEESYVGNYCYQPEKLVILK